MRLSESSKKDSVAGNGSDLKKFFESGGYAAMLKV